MAELPDLTVFAGILTKRFAGKKLKEVEVKEDGKLNVSAKELKAALEGKQLKSVTREGKTLQLHFDDQVLGVHLMLRGELILIDEDNPQPRFGILYFHFATSGFAVVDLQKIATPTLNPPVSSVPDALAAEMDLTYFSNLLAKKRTTIKTLLMDQHMIRGIGNSYADEILWHAKISPFSIAKAIPEKEVNQLYKSLRSVLQKAIHDIEKENGDELRGELRDFMKVHGAKIEKSPTGAKIKAEKIGGRMSYYTEEQELYT